MFSRANRPFGLPQLKKRKIEDPSMTTVSKIFPKPISEMNDDKRRKKPEDIEAKSLMLPQKKRMLPISTDNSPAKKSQKISSDESAADETLIRETEAALKNLSGSWPGPRGSIYNKKQEESPAFENLFDEKKASVKLSPSSSTSNASNDNACSLKDVITLRDQHEDSGEEKCELKSAKMKQDDKVIRVKTEITTQYEPPDFNELVDDSSNELEIDMSESASEKNDGKVEMRCNRKPEEVKSGKYGQNPVYPHPSPLSTSSAFRPTQVRNATLSNLGPMPAEATFVGYPGDSSSDDKPKTSNLQAEIKSPEAASKQYTILQPAAAGSRAANALQEVAREGVPSVAAVAGAEPKMVPTGTLSPNSLGRGK